MFSNIVIYVILTVLSLTTAYAMGKPISKSAQEHVEPTADDKESENSL